MQIILRDGVSKIMRVAFCDQSAIDLSIAIVTGAIPTKILNCNNPNKKVYECTEDKVLTRPVRIFFWTGDRLIVEE
jgi:hypothetical protein